MFPLAIGEMLRVEEREQLDVSIECEFLLLSAAIRLRRLANGRVQGPTMS
jgi:hypothetical protein